MKYVELKGDKKVSVKVGETGYTHKISIEDGNGISDAPIQLNDDGYAYINVKNGTYYLKS